MNDRDGVLILSENAGAHEEFGEWSLCVNPFDVFGQAEAIHAALTMPTPTERRRGSTGCVALSGARFAAWIAERSSPTSTARTI